VVLSRKRPAGVYGFFIQPINRSGESKNHNRNVRARKKTEKEADIPLIALLLLSSVGDTSL